MDFLIKFVFHKNLAYRSPNKTFHLFGMSKNCAYLFTGLLAIKLGAQKLDYKSLWKLDLSVK